MDIKTELKNLAATYRQRATQAENRARAAEAASKPQIATLARIEGNLASGCGKAADAGFWPIPVCSQAVPEPLPAAYSELQRACATAGRTKLVRPDYE